jgi:branched-subunit amino acid transport protein
MTWLIVCGLTAITFFNRYLFFSGRLTITLGIRAQRFLRYSSFAVLTAIWVPIIFQLDYESMRVGVAGWDYIIAASLAGLLTVVRVPALFVVLLSSAVFFCLRFWLLT